MKSFIQSKGREDILRQYEYYLLEEAVEEVAERFLFSIESTIKQLCKHPHIGSPRSFSNNLLQGLRSWPVDGFEAIRIYYIAGADELRILRILHGKRDVESLFSEDVSLLEQ